MRTVSIEVKTFYDLRFDFHDFVKIFTEAKNDSTRSRAFKNFDLEDTTMGNLQNCFESLGKLSIFMSVEESKQQTENLKYIVRKLGFYGISFYGGFYGNDKEEGKHGKEYHITVYNMGADI